MTGQLVTNVATLMREDAERVLLRVEKEIGTEEANLLRAFIDRSVYPEIIDGRLKEENGNTRGDSSPVVCGTE